LPLSATITVRREAKLSMNLLWQGRCSANMLIINKGLRDGSNVAEMAAPVQED